MFIILVCECTCMLYLCITSLIRSMVLLIYTNYMDYANNQLCNGTSLKVPPELRKPLNQEWLILFHLNILLPLKKETISRDMLILE